MTISGKLMKQDSVNVEPHLYSILERKTFDKFTVMQLRDEYMEISVINTDMVKARLFVYRQILRLVRIGLLSKQISKNTRQSTYIKTKKFSQTKFSAWPDGQAAKTQSADDIERHDALNKLESQLKQYKMDAMASVGESEEYMRLYESNPQFKVFLESVYLQARDQSSKLFGRITALNNFIQHCS